MADLSKLTKDEVVILQSGLDALVRSAKVSQNRSAMPNMKVMTEKWIAEVMALKAKLS